MLVLRALVLPFITYARGAAAAFGFTESGNNIVVDAGSANSLVFSVSKSSCDVNSIKYRGIELQSLGKGTQIGSGLGSASVSATLIDGSSRFIKITCKTPTLTQYLIVKEEDSTIYLATHITAEPTIGELRWLARLNNRVLPYEYPFGNASTTPDEVTRTVEGSDVFVVDGETRSKFYSSQRFIDQVVHCVYGENTPEAIHVCIMIPQFESSSGGPFFRDINSNCVGGGTTNLFHYMNSGHVQTEKNRMGLHGPYIMSFTGSEIPNTQDYDVNFYEELELEGYVSKSERGTVSGIATGVPDTFQPVVHWFNEAAQYWTIPSSNGSFTSPAMKPGTYAMVLYQTEYKVAESTVVVSKGSTIAASIASTLQSHKTLWQIGDLDGQPTGFRNADKFLRMHPSDARMDSWGPLTYTVGSSPVSDFPMALFKDVNTPATIKFTLDSPLDAATLRLATTLSFAGGRPSVVVNGWTGPVPSAPTKIDSRGVTRGAYRGFGEEYLVNIPAGVLIAGSNTITISVASGSSGATFLSPNVIMDSIELFQ